MSDRAELIREARALVDEYGPPPEWEHNHRLLDMVDRLRMALEADAAEIARLNGSSIALAADNLRLGTRTAELEALVREVVETKQLSNVMPFPWLKRASSLLDQKDKS